MRTVYPFAAVNQESGPLVTIMVPTYNQARYLPKAIASALAQDYEPVEVIIADDASPDDTRTVVEAFAHDPRVRYEVNERNLGRVANYRKTLNSLARGEFVINLDGDDWLTDPTYLSNAVELLMNEPDVALVFANAWSYLESSNELTRLTSQNLGLDRVNDGNELFLRYADAAVWIPHQTAVYRRQVAMDIGCYSLDVIGSDMDSLLRMILDRKVGFIANTVAAWRFHDVNATRSLDLGQRVANLACVESPFEAARASSQIDLGRLERWRKKMLVRLTNDFVRRAVGSGDYVTAVRFYGRILTAHPTVAIKVAIDSVVRGVELLGAGASPDVLTVTEGDLR